MARIEADADPYGAFEAADDCGQALEPVTEGAALAGACLQEHHRFASRSRLERLANGVRNQPEPVVFGACRAGARMNNHAEQSERIGAIQLVDESGDRLLPERAERCREVDQVTGV